MALYDKDIREILKAEFPHSRMVDEINIYNGTCRIDLLDITDTLIGWEIKSDNDSLARLDHQIATYSKCLPYINIACGPKYVDKIKNIIPEYVGVYEVYKCPAGRAVIDCIREAQKNPEMKASNTLALLWKSEMLSVISRYDKNNYYRYSKWRLAKEMKKYVWDRRCPSCRCGNYAPENQLERIKKDPGFAWVKCFIRLHL